MSEINISIEGGTSKRLLTAGKFCNKDIVVTAEGGGNLLKQFIEGTLTELYDEEVESVGDYAFYYTTMPSRVELPNVRRVGAMSFCYSKQTEIVLPKLEEIGNSAFANFAALVEVDYPLVNSISYQAFKSCANLTKINFPLIEKISGQYAFAYCPALVDVNLPKLTEVPSYTFQKCTALTHVVLPNVTKTENHSFIECSSLRVVDLPKATNCSGSFSKCGALIALILRNTGKVCGTGSAALSFSSQSPKTPIELGTGFIYVPAALLDGYKTHTYWSSLANQFRALEDYTVDGTVTGALDESKI